MSTAGRRCGWAAAALLVTVGGCRFGDESTATAPPPAIPVARAERGPFRVAVSEVGVFEAGSSVSVQAPYWGKVEEVAEEGSWVEAGDPVLRMDTADRRRVLERLESDLRAARSDLEKRLEQIALQEKLTGLDARRLTAQERFDDATLEHARTQAEDARRRADLGIVRGSAAEQRERSMAEEEVRHRQAQLASARQREELASGRRQLEVQRREAERRVAQAQRRVDRLRRELDDAVVRAPAAGRVFLPKVRFWGTPEPRKIRAGDQVTPWLGALVELPDSSALRVLSQVDESLVTKVRPGVRAEVRVTAAGGLVLPGRVATVTSLAVPRSKSPGAGYTERVEGGGREQVVFPVRVTLAELDQRIQPGMSADVTFLLDELSDAVSVPADAVFGPADAPIVYVRSGSRSEARRVRLGATSGGRVVVEDGLSGDETVLLGQPDLARRAGA